MMWYSYSLRDVLVLFSFVTLAACGGGDGSNPAAPTYTISGTVSGLSGSGLVLQNNEGDDLAIAPNNTDFSFSTALADGANYRVTVKAHPNGPTQLCTVDSGTGTVSGAHVTGITINCVTAHTVSAIVTGLEGQGLVLQNNALDALSVNGNGQITFPVPLAANTNYTVSVQVYPSHPAQLCLLTNNTGTVLDTDVANISISCTSNVHTVGGTVSGLQGTGLKLRNGNELLSIAANNNNFTFNTPLLSGTDYEVSVETGPRNPVQECTLSNASGTASSSNVTNIAINCQTRALALFAGNVSGYGNVDGTGTNAWFYNPYGVATDSLGNVYVADEYNAAIRKITPSGEVTTLVNRLLVKHIATDSVGNIYVVDFTGNSIKKVTSSGGSVNVTTFATGFQSIKSIATDTVGNVYVTDKHTIRKITISGTSVNVTALAGAEAGGDADGVGANAGFSFPSGIATDSLGNVYVADSGNNTIRKITPEGVVSTLAGQSGVHSRGSTDGLGAAARFYSPGGIATDSAGNVYVADSGNNTIRKITPSGQVTTLAGAAGSSGYADGVGTNARFYSPGGIATDSLGNIYVKSNQTIRKITANGAVTTFAGTPRIAGSEDGTVSDARFSFDAYDNDSFVAGIDTDDDGNVYVADYINHTIRKITPNGQVTTLAGAAGLRGSADGLGAAARFDFPTDIATDSVGNVYVADRGNHTVRKITPGGQVTTLAGAAGSSGSVDGLGANARFDFPNGIATDNADNVYVTSSRTIRKITISGTSVDVTTLAGAAGLRGSTDGLGAAARFDFPNGIATDSVGNVYVADRGNHTVRKITPGGQVTTLAGAAGSSGSVDGLGAAARFLTPEGITVDSAGNVYVADTTGNTIRKITPSGMVSTLVGVPEQAGFKPGALPGVITFPFGLSVYGSSLYITMSNGVAVVQDSL